MEQLLNIISTIQDFVWGVPLVAVLLGTGVLLTLRNIFVQFRGFKHSFELISGKYDKPEFEGAITHFQALSAALSATIGTGNIAGVATAIAIGGPGALFWMWVTAVFGMALKFSCCTLAVLYRRIDPDGYVRGGPMYYIEMGLGNKWKWLAFIFAACTAITALGIGNMVQANSVADGLATLFGAKGAAHETYFRLGVGMIMAILAGLVIVGGIKRIGQVASRLVPFMCVLYVLTAIVVLIISYDRVLPALALIFERAFTPTGAAGGFAGSTVWLTLQQGVRRGLFSNESGLGSAPMAHAAAKVNEPVREGLVAMIGPFIDTIVICTMTGLVIIVTGKWMELGPDGLPLNGTPLTAAAFESVIPSWGARMVSIGLVLFAYSTIISWSYYGEKGFEYIFSRKWVIYYRWFFLIFIPIGAVLIIDIVWAIADIFNAFMAAPNLVALIGLSGVVAAATRKYFKELRAGGHRS